MIFKNTELTFKTIILGIILSIILSAANTYLGLFAGMTVSASIPAAILSMTILRCFKSSSILEHNLVQTSASAGESLAAGVIFTFPALILLGYWTEFDYLEVTKIAFIGGILGALFTIPLRKVLIEEKKLKFPEGIATSKILKSNNNIEMGKIILYASILGLITKFFQNAIKLWDTSIEYIFKIKNSLFGIGLDLSPALLGVGYIIGINIGFLVLLGGIISWLIAMPIYSSYFLSQDQNLNNLAWHIWDTKIRFLGVGAMLIGGLWSIIQLISPIFQTLSNNLNFSKNKDLPLSFILILLIILSYPLFSIYYNIFNSSLFSIFITITIFIIAFLFAAVAAYMAGMVGSSNNPISGITILTILFSSLFINSINFNNIDGMVASILIGAIICCSSAIAGDNMQDLKTGYILNASPWKQQLMQILGTTASALTITFTLNILHSAYEIGSESLPAPQAHLMKSIDEGVFNQQLPWNWIIAGIFIGIIIIIIDMIQKKRKSNFRFPVLAVAVGIYLPIGLSLPIFIGSLISYYSNNNDKGVLFSSGLITGEAIMGILIALPIFLTSNKNWWNLSIINQNLNYIGYLNFLLIIIGLYYISKKTD